VITDDNMLVEYRHGRRFGPEPLVAALPPSTRHFTMDRPAHVLPPPPPPRARPSTHAGAAPAVP
jgi:hypothetical protein